MTLHLTELLEKEVARVTTQSYNIQSIEHMHMLQNKEESMNMMKQEMNDTKEKLNWQSKK